MDQPRPDLSDPVIEAFASAKLQFESGAGLPWLKREKKKTDPDELVTEDSVALAFTEKHAGMLRYDHTAGAWFRWTGTHWQREETRLAFAWCRALAREAAAAAPEDQVAISAGRASFASGVERFAQSDRAFAVTSSTWDADPWLLATPGGTVDLKTGKLRPSIREDYITRVTTAAPAATADCLRWRQFLEEVTGGDEELMRFLAQWFGYCLTGITREHALLFVYGPGGNGKGVLLNTIGKILGQLTATAAMDTFTASSGDRHPTDLAMLHGPRLVMTTETEEGRAWAESRIKQMTGGDPITARFMRRDFFTFTPAFKLAISGNHKPVLRNVDEAARRRFNIVPFNFAPSPKDPELEAKLQREWPGILRWMIDGCLDWQANGLQRPQVVLDATAEYFSEQDLVGQWVADHCDTGRKTLADTTEALFKAWTAYALASGEKPGTSRWFSQTLQRRGFRLERETPGHRGKRGFSGIALKPLDTSGQWQNINDR